jgi:hypothetical protein
MSLPQFPDNLTKEGAINEILHSIAHEEDALSKIMEAESQKVQFAVNELNKASEKDLNKMLEINCSVQGIIQNINDMQIILKNKLISALSHTDKPENWQDLCCSLMCTKNCYQDTNKSNLLCLSISDPNECMHIYL